MSDPHRPRLCLEPEVLAAYLDGGLPPELRRDVERHLADCEDCREIVAESIRNLSALGATPAATGQPDASRARARRVVLATAALAAAAAIAVIVWRPEWVPGFRGAASASPVLRELVAAVGSSRPIAGRLSGGFAWGPEAADVRSGTGSRRDVSPEVQIAAAHAEQRVAAERTPQALGDFAAAQIVRGAIDDAVRTLREATSLDAASARLWSDLSAALLARFARTADPPDLPEALECAIRALRIEPRSAEAAFNKALALEMMGVRDQAREAWQQYLAIDAASPWADEARQRLTRLSQAASAAATTFDPQTARERLFEVLLAQWAAAIDDPARQRALDEAAAHVERLDVASPDRLAHDVVERVRVSRGASRAALIEAHALFARARVSYRAARYARALPDFQAARRSLDQADSPLGVLAAVFAAACQYQGRDTKAALATLAEARAALGAHETYPSIAGRLGWLAGLLAVFGGDHRRAGLDYAAALHAFQAAGERANAGFVKLLIGENLVWLGDFRGAWGPIVQAVSESPRPGPPLEVAANALRFGWTGVAAAFQDRTIAMARENGDLPTLGDSLRVRALTFVRDGDRRQAARLLDEAEAIGRDPEDPVWNRFRAELDYLRAREQLSGDPGANLAAADRALAYFRSANATIRLPRLHLARATVLHAAGRAADAEADLRTSLELLDRERARIDASPQRATFQDEVRRHTQQLARLLVGQRRTDEALAAAERARSWDLLRHWTASPTPVTVDQLKARLPRDAAAIVYLVQPEEIFIWTVRRSETGFVRVPVAEDTLARLIWAYNENPGNRGVAERLGALLLDPVAPALSGRDLLIIAPDGPLHLLPFAGLPAGTQLVVDRHATTVVPSVTAWLYAASRLPQTHSAAPLRLTAVDPAIDRGIFPDLPDLQWSAQEIQDILPMYPVHSRLHGGQADAGAILKALGHSDVVHFAGHAIPNPLDPGRSELVAPSASGERLTAAVIARQSNVAARLVVLAACQGAVGPLVNAEGPLGLARAFMAAGVPSVVASHWLADDRSSAALFAAFHRAYIESSSAPVALQRAQQELRRSSNPQLSAPAHWAGFVAFGGNP